MAKRSNTLTRFIEDIVDDTKDFVDDLLERASGLETDARDAVRKAIDDEDAPKSKKTKKYDGELADLSAAIAELTATVNALAAAKAA